MSPRRASASPLIAIALLSLMPLAARADGGADATAEVKAKLGPWSGALEETQEERRPLHFAEVPVELSVSCPAGTRASSLEYDFDPAAGVIDPPASGGAVAKVAEGASQSASFTASLKPGAIYRVRAKGRCCTALDGAGGCGGSGEVVEVISEALELPPVIEAARVLVDGLHYGGLVSGRSLDLTVYDSSPTPNWSIGADNVRKFLKFTGAGVNFKTSDYRGTNSMGLSTLLPTQAGQVEVTLTIKGKLYAPQGKYLRDYTLVSAPFAIPVTSEPCVLDANVTTFITAGAELECLDGSVLKPEELKDVGEGGEGGCASAGGAGLMSWLALAAIPALKRRRRR